MLRLFIALQLLQTTTVRRVARPATHPARERGSVTLEQVVIALGLFLIAGLVIAGITAAIESRLSQIN